MFDVLFEQKLEAEAEAEAEAEDEDQKQKQKLKMENDKRPYLLFLWCNDDDEWRFEKSLSSSISIGCIKANWT